LLGVLDLTIGAIGRRRISEGQTGCAGAAAASTRRVSNGTVCPGSGAATRSAITSAKANCQPASRHGPNAMSPRAAYACAPRSEKQQLHATTKGTRDTRTAGPDRSLRGTAESRASLPRFVFLFTAAYMHRDCSTRVHGGVGGGVTPTQPPYPPSGARTQLATNQLHAAGGVRWTNRDLVFICLCCCWRLYYMESTSDLEK